jgi:hypothetical protein
MTSVRPADVPSDPGAWDRRLMTRIALAMAVVAATLAVASALHLTGHVSGRHSPFDADHAGVAEAIIAAVLVAGAAVMIFLPSKARITAVLVNGFAVVGFIVGLTMTTRGGHLPDITYHLVVLPVLVINFVAALGARSGSDGTPPSSRRRASLMPPV